MTHQKGSRYPAFTAGFGGADVDGRSNVVDGRTQA
jgi:hypothetical protein